MATALAVTPLKEESALDKSERLGAEITELCSYIYAAEHRFLTLIREFDEQRGWAWLGFHTCAHWLNFNCGMGMNAARERVRIAHALGNLPKIDARFASGALSYSKVRAMTRIADAKNEDYLLMIAKHGTAYHVEKLVSKYRRVVRLNDADAARTEYDNRQLNCYTDWDGSLVIKGRFPAEQGALIVKALEMAMEKQFSEKADVGAASRRDRAGTALPQDDVDVSADHVPLGQTSESPEPEPIATRRADALAEVAETYMNSEPVPNATADRYQVVVHVLDRAGTALPQALPQAGIDRGHGPLPQEDPHIEDGPHVSAETSRRIACDCSLLGIREDERGEPLSIGRKTRSIPPAMRRALRIRDGGCRFPGCTNDRFVDGHHIQHWADGGETSLDNLVLLCRRHHHLVHEGGFTCEKTSDGEVFFQDQRQILLPKWSVVPTIGEDDINEWLDRQFFEDGTGPEGCNAQWYAGDQMDWNLAVGHLFV